MTENDISRHIVDSAFRVHTALGPGLFESVCEAALPYELFSRGLRVQTQHPIPIIYESIRMEAAFRADLLVEDRVIVEIKSVDILAPLRKKQLLTYLRLSGVRLGLLINFNVPLIKHGITRLVNNL